MSAAVSNRQNRECALSRLSAGRPAFASAAFSPSRSHTATGAQSSARAVLIHRSRARRTTYKDSCSVAAINLGIDELENHHAAIERENLAILLTGGLPGGTDKVAPGSAAFEAQLLELGGIRKVHHDAAARSLPDHERLLALPARVRFGAGAVLRLVVGGIAPSAHDFRRAHLGGNLRRRQRHLRRLRRWSGGTGGKQPCRLPNKHDRPSPIETKHRSIFLLVPAFLAQRAKANAAKLDFLLSAAWLTRRQAPQKFRHPAARSP